jgi:hypothetical protein
MEPIVPGSQAFARPRQDVAATARDEIDSATKAAKMAIKTETVTSRGS